MKIFVLSNLFLLTLAALATGAERKIAFERGGGVWTANLDGTGAKKIARGVWPNISPDGMRVAFNTEESSTKQTGPASRHIAVADISSGKVTLLKEIPSEQCYDARWSPDGSKISFRVMIDQQWHRGIVNADGSGFHLVNGLLPDSPAWGRDGKSIFGYDFENLFQSDLDGNVAKKWKLSKVLTERDENGNAQVTGLSVSPNGNMLLLDVDFGGPAAIYAFDLVEEKTTRVTSNKDVATESCWLTNDEFLCMIFKDKEKPGHMRSIYRISLNDKLARFVINGDAMNPSVSAP